jgi:hypothetical protein
LSSQFYVLLNQISKWKSVLLDNLEVLFHDGRQKEPKDDAEVNELYQKIGRLEVENDFLKNRKSFRYRETVIFPEHVALSIRDQCRLFSVPHSSFYYIPVCVSLKELDLMKRFEQFHFELSVFGSHRLTVQFGISRDKVIHLMRKLYIVATYPQCKTTIPNHNHKKYP